VDHRRTDYPLSGNLQPRGQLKTALTKPPFSWIDHLIRPLQERRRNRQAEDDPKPGVRSDQIAVGTSSSCDV
jgi:hypothetical protein